VKYFGSTVRGATLVLLPGGTAHFSDSVFVSDFTTKGAFDILKDFTAVNSQLDGFLPQGSGSFYSQNSFVFRAPGGPMSANLFITSGTADISAFISLTANNRIEIAPSATLYLSADISPLLDGGDVYNRGLLDISKDKSSISIQTNVSGGGDVKIPFPASTLTLRGQFIELGAISGAGTLRVFPQFGGSIKNIELGGLEIGGPTESFRVNQIKVQTLTLNTDRDLSIPNLVIYGNSSAQNSLFEHYRLASDTTSVTLTIQTLNFTGPSDKIVDKITLSVHTLSYINGASEANVKYVNGAKLTRF